MKQTMRRWLGGVVTACVISICWPGASAEASYVNACRLRARVARVILAELSNGSEVTQIRIRVLQAKTGGRSDSGCKQFVNTDMDFELGELRNGTGKQPMTELKVGDIAYFEYFVKDVEMTEARITSVKNIGRWTRIATKDFDAKIK
jgi:hypothetical protein